MIFEGTAAGLARRPRQVEVIEMRERPRVLVLDLLESFSRERDVNIRIERRKSDHAWVCTVTNGLPGEVRTTGATAREAIRAALEEAGVELPS